MSEGSEFSFSRELSSLLCGLEFKGSLGATTVVAVEVVLSETVSALPLRDRDCWLVVVDIPKG